MFVVRQIKVTLVPFNGLDKNLGRNEKCLAYANLDLTIFMMMAVACFRFIIL